MPFCSNCGKELQEDWNICPFCSSPIQQQYGSISDSVIVNDYNIHNTIENKTDVNNHMLTLIDALKDGREDRAIEILEIAKKIDYNLATELYNVEYADVIAAYKIELLVKEWSLAKENWTPHFLDSLEVKIEKERIKAKSCKNIISKCYDLINYNPEFVDSVEFFYDLWLMMPGYFMLNESGEFRVSRDNEIGSIPGSFIIKLFRTAGSQERADSLQTMLKHKEINAAEEMESIEIMLKILGSTVMILIILFLVIFWLAFIL